MASTPGGATLEASSRRPHRPRKSPVLEASGSVTDKDLDGGNTTESTHIRSDEQSSSDELQKEFLSILSRVKNSEEGDLSGRRRPSCKGIQVAQNVLMAVDDLIVEEYQKGEQTDWRLNCLVYAGAELVSHRVRRTFPRYPRSKRDRSRKRRCSFAG